MSESDFFKVEQHHRDAAADLIERYWPSGTIKGAQMRKLAASYRDGHTAGVWADAFAQFEARFHHSGQVARGEEELQGALRELRLADGACGRGVEGSDARWDRALAAVLAFEKSPTPPSGQVGTQARYHFTDDQPFTVQTAEGLRALGKGWLAITEAEYAALSPAASRGAMPGRDEISRNDLARVGKGLQIAETLSCDVPITPSARHELEMAHAAYARLLTARGVA